MAMQQVAPPFEKVTRRKTLTLETKSKPTGGGLLSWNLEPAGILQSINVYIPISIAGSLSAPNAFGVCSAIRRIQLRANAGYSVFDMSGIDYHWLVKDSLYDMRQRVSWSEARLAVTTGAKDLSLIIPVALNDREQVGLINLQNRQTQLTLYIEFEADANVATGATITGTVTPELVLFEPPSNPKSFPDLSTIHQYLGDTNTVAGSGQYDYNVQLGASLVGLFHLIQGTTYTQAQLISQQSNNIETHTPDTMRLQFNTVTGSDLNQTGTALTGYNNRVFYQFAGDDGLGNYGVERDFIDTTILTSLISRLSLAGGGSLRTVREQVLRLSA